MALGPQPLFTAKTADPAAPPTGEGIVVGDIFAAIFAATTPARPAAGEMPAAPASEEAAVEGEATAGEGEVPENPLLTLAAILLPVEPAKPAVAVVKPDVATPQPAATTKGITPSIPAPAPAHPEHPEISTSVVSTPAPKSEAPAHPQTQCDAPVVAKPAGPVAARIPTPQVMLPPIDSIAEEPKAAATPTVAPPPVDGRAPAPTIPAQPAVPSLPVAQTVAHAQTALDAPITPTPAPVANTVSPAPAASPAPPLSPEVAATPAVAQTDEPQAVAPREVVVTLLRCEIPAAKGQPVVQDAKAQIIAATIAQSPLPAATIVQAAGVASPVITSAPAAKDRVTRVVNAPIESIRAKMAESVAPILSQAVSPADALPFAVTAAPQAAPVAAQPLAAPVPVAEALIAQKLDMAHEGEWLDQLARDIAGTGGKDGMMRFRLNPENLGSLQVEVKHAANGTAVRMTADTDAARAIIVDAQPRLIAEARAQGVRISETHVDVGQHGQHAQSGFGDSRRREDSEQQTVLRAARGKKSVTTSTLTMSGRAADRYA